MSRRERIRLQRNEEKIAKTIAIPIALVLLIIAHIFRVITKTLFLSKRWIGRMCITLFILYSSYNALQGMVYAPKPVMAMDGAKHTYNIPTLNPNISQRQQNIELIQRVWGSDASIGEEIARCESGYRTLATNYNTNFTVDQGVFQINSSHNMPQMDVAVANIEYAYLLYQQQGTQPWNSSSGCWN